MDPMLLGGHPVVDIAAGTDHTIFLADDGTLMTCGSDGSFQLGQGELPDLPNTFAVRSVPAKPAHAHARLGRFPSDASRTPFAAPTDVCLFFVVCMLAPSPSGRYGAYWGPIQRLTSLSLPLHPALQHGPDRTHPPLQV